MGRTMSANSVEAIEGMENETALCMSTGMGLWGGPCDDSMQTGRGNWPFGDASAQWLATTTPGLAWHGWRGSRAEKAHIWGTETLITTMSGRGAAHCFSHKPDPLLSGSTARWAAWEGAVAVVLRLFDTDVS